MSEDYQTPRGTELLCRNIVETSFDRLSEDNIRIFRDRLLDMTGCILGGAVVAEDRFLENRFKEWGGKGEAPLFASDGRMPLPAAALLNSLKARANDFGSMLFVAFGEAIPSHVGETLIPLGLTLADMHGVSGEQFVTHNMAAEDFAARVLYSMPERWPADMLLVSSAAAALAGRYYGLDAERMKAALSFAATNATDPSNAYYDYSHEFKLHNGVSAQTGVMAAEYAKGGWRGLEDPYFGHWGLVSKQTKDGGEPPLYRKCFEGLGSVYFTECGFKRGPGGIPTTAAALCGIKLHELLVAQDGAIVAEEIVAVHVYGSKDIYHGYYSNPFRLRDQVNALFSYGFSACCGLLNGKVTVATVQTSAINADPELVRLAESATMDIYEPASGGKKIKVTVAMRDGRVLEAEEDFMSMVKYPSKQILVDKFWDQFNTFGRLPKRNGEKLVELASRIEELEDMREYTELLCIR
jgi:2-methylcitrate dehydratase PrpD